MELLLFWHCKGSHHSVSASDFLEEDDVVETLSLVVSSADLVIIDMPGAVVVDVLYVLNGVGDTPSVGEEAKFPIGRRWAIYPLVVFGIEDFLVAKTAYSAPFVHEINCSCALWILVARTGVKPFSCITWLDLSIDLPTEDVGEGHRRVTSAPFCFLNWAPLGAREGSWVYQLLAGESNATCKKKQGWKIANLKEKK